MEETLGKRIAQHRKGLGLTQDALAEQLGVTAQAVSKWENNQSYPDITMLPKLAEIFDTTTDALLGVGAKESLDLPANADTIHEDTGAAEETGNLRKAMASPGAAFGVWLFLTGAVLFVTKMRNMLCGIEDIAIACGVFAFGLYGFFRRFSLLRLGCAAAGGIFVLQLLNTSIGDIDWTVPLAAAIALFGLDLFIDSIRGPKGVWWKMPEGHLPEAASRNYCTYDGSRFDCAVCFGEGHRLIQLPVLTGGQADVTFGQLTIDLSGCAEIQEGCTIDLRCGFGSLNILIPRKYRVETTASSAFGAVEEKETPLPEAEGTIYLNCRASFGQITVRHI